MSNIQKWAHIHKTFDETSRAKIVTRMYSIKDFRKRLYYWGLLATYGLVSIPALFFSQTYFFYSVLAVFVMALCLYGLLERKLSIDLKDVYEPHCLNDHPIFMRARYLHFVTFKKRLDEEQIVKPEDVESLLRWDEIKNEKVSLNVFFQSKIFLVVFTATIGLLAKVATGANLNLEEWMIVAYLVIVFVWVFWMVFDFSQLPHRKRVDLNRFLKWYELEGGINTVSNSSST